MIERSARSATWPAARDAVYDLIESAGSREELAALLIPYLRARHAEAVVTLAMVYTLDDIVAHDTMKAATFLRWAAARGSAVACHNLGGLCLILGQRDDATFWYERAKELDSRLGLPASR